jgi:multidrug efflux system membrane fusion protein
MSSQSKRRTCSLAIALLLGVAACGGGGGAKTEASKRGGGAPVPVVAGPVRTEDVPEYLDGVGTVQGFQTVTVRSRVDGALVQVAFQEGQQVHKGDLLAQIDPRPFQAVVDQALAKKAQDEAQLGNAKRDLVRYTSLVEQKLLQEQTLDTQRAAVAQLEAQIKSDAAQIAAAQVQLAYTRITAPIDGRTGIRQIDQGNIIHASDANGLVVLTQLTPAVVIFTLPEQQLDRVVTQQEQHPLEVVAMSQDGSRKLGEGQLLLVDNQIDVATGTMRLKAVFPNQDHKLWPGEFVNARLLVDVRKNGLVVPAPVVQRGPQGTFVFVIKPDSTVESRPIEVSQIESGLALIAQGLEPGEQVVIDGQYRLQPGSKVTVQAPAQAGGQPSTRARAGTGGGGGGHDAGARTGRP